MEYSCCEGEVRVLRSDGSKTQRLNSRANHYLCRIQIQSPRTSYLHGTWFRAFDFQRWEPWASSGDAGWGAWSVEAGWAQAWTVAALGLRLKQTTLWKVTAGTRIRDKLSVVNAAMARNQGEPWRADAIAPAAPTPR